MYITASNVQWKRWMKRIALLTTVITVVLSIDFIMHVITL